MSDRIETPVHAPVRLNAYTDNLGDEWVGVNDLGEPIARADSPGNLKGIPGVVAAYNAEMLAATADPAGFAAFDHDGDGKPGGSVKRGRKKK